jgi:hypothetical protein
MHHIASYHVTSTPPCSLPLLNSKYSTEVPYSECLISHTALLFVALYHVVLQVIKKRIEALIDREYLERDTENSNTYRYLA